LIAGKSGVAARNSDSWKEDGEVSESVAKRYNSMVLDGKIRGAVRFATGRGLGGPKSPMDKCSKSGELVIDVLRKKHPTIRTPKIGKSKIGEVEAYPAGVQGFDHYPHGASAVIPNWFDCHSMEEVSKTLDGGPGPGGLDSRQFKILMSRFGTASENLRVEWALWSEWLSNESPPYAAYRALNAKSLDKYQALAPWLSVKSG
jgi:hypothetical protein